MKNNILFLAVFLPGYCLAQLQVSFSTGLAGFQMTEMKTHQAELRADFPVNVKVFESFPPYWSYEFAVLGSVTEKFRLGGMVGYTSTGGWMHYSDYSGEVSCEQLTTAITLAVQGDVLLNKNEKLPVYFVFKSGVTKGHYDLDLFFHLENAEPDSDDIDFNSNNLFIEQGFALSTPIYRKLVANFSAGYNLNVLKGKLKLQENNNLFLLDDSRREVKLDWSGFRLSAGVAVSF